MREEALSVGTLKSGLASGSGSWSLGSGARLFRLVEGVGMPPGLASDIVVLGGPQPGPRVVGVVLASGFPLVAEVQFLPYKNLKRAK